MKNPVWNPAILGGSTWERNTIVLRLVRILFSKQKKKRGFCNSTLAMQWTNGIHKWFGQIVAIIESTHPVASRFWQLFDDLPTGFGNGRSTWHFGSWWSFECREATRVIATLQWRRIYQSNTGEFGRSHDLYQDPKGIFKTNLLNHTNTPKRSHGLALGLFIWGPLLVFSFKHNL